MSHLTNICVGKLIKINKLVYVHAQLLFKAVHRQFYHLLLLSPYRVYTWTLLPYPGECLLLSNSLFVIHVFLCIRNEQEILDLKSNFSRYTANGLSSQTCMRMTADEPLAYNYMHATVQRLPF